MSTYRPLQRDPPIYQTPFQQIYTAVFPEPATRWQKFTYFSGIDEWKVRKVAAKLWKNLQAPARTEEEPLSANWSEVQAYLDLRTYEECLLFHQEVRTQKMEKLIWAERIAYRIAHFFLTYFLKKPETPTFPSLESKVLIWDEIMTTFPTNSLNLPRTKGQMGVQLSIHPDTQLASGLTLFWDEENETRASLLLSRIWENEKGEELREIDLQLGLQDKVCQKFYATKVKAGFLIDDTYEISDRTFAILVKTMVEEMRASKWDSLRIKKEYTPSAYLSILEQLGFEFYARKHEYRLERDKLSLIQIAWINDDFSRDIKTWDAVAEPKASFYPLKLHVDPSQFIISESL